MSSPAPPTYEKDSESVPYGDIDLANGEGRRRKAALVLFALWSIVVALHYSDGGQLLVWGLTAIASVHLFRLLVGRPAHVALPAASDTVPAAEASQMPFVSVLVSAKDEEAVVARLVQQLDQVNYPRDRYEAVIIDDASSDRTPELLDELVGRSQSVRTIHRKPGAGGGKSGALNSVIPKTKGEILAIFDADAQFSPDLFRRVVPLFNSKDLGAVQLQKAVAQTVFNQPERSNFWVQGQTAEMQLDCCLQQQRIAADGIGELRGNGQFLRRSALDDCRGFNEETITDDLDLTLRLHLEGWNIEAVTEPAVIEEGVTTLKALWHQRNRWAEGGYQRYLDYWQSLGRNQMGSAKTFDMSLFCLFQYLLPQAVIPDFLMAVIRQEATVLSPLLTLTFGFSAVMMFRGIRRGAIAKIGEKKGESLVLSEVLPLMLVGSIYMVHWFVVISTMGLRISVRPKRLKWVKTVHQGSEDSPVAI
ncbi:MAG: glycosyltransferase family 2 protein [Cyanobacteria bacterium P01_D01_bin.73]